jgi:hypothetical protein
MTGRLVSYPIYLLFGTQVIKRQTNYHGSKQS